MRRAASAWALASDASLTSTPIVIWAVFGVASTMPEPSTLMPEFEGVVGDGPGTVWAEVDWPWVTRAKMPMARPNATARRANTRDSVYSDLEMKGGPLETMPYQHCREQREHREKANGERRGAPRGCRVVARLGRSQYPRGDGDGSRRHGRSRWSERRERLGTRSRRGDELIDVGRTGICRGCRS